MTKWRELEQKFGHDLATIVVVLLVGLTGFLLGREYQPKGEVTTADEQTAQTAAPAPMVAELAELIESAQTPQAPPVPAPSPRPVATPAGVGLVNVNTAGLVELDTLPGIGPKYAQAIIDFRTTHGPFQRIEDLEKVRGIGPKTLERLRPLVTL